MMHNSDNVIARNFLVSIAYALLRPQRKFLLFYYICLEKMLDITHTKCNPGRFKMLALLAMAGEDFEDDVNSVTLFNRFYDQKHHGIIHKNCRNCSQVLSDEAFSRLI